MILSFASRFSRSRIECDLPTPRSGVALVLIPCSAHPVGTPRTIWRRIRYRLLSLWADFRWFRANTQCANSIGYWDGEQMHISKLYRRYFTWARLGIDVSEIETRRNCVAYLVSEPALSTITAVARIIPRQGNPNIQNRTLYNQILSIAYSQNRRIVSAYAQF